MNIMGMHNVFYWENEYQQEIYQRRKHRKLDELEVSLKRVLLKVYNISAFQKYIRVYLKFEFSRYPLN